MYRSLYEDPKFVGAQISPPDLITVIMEDGIEYFNSKVQFRSEATLDKQTKQVKGTTQGKQRIVQLFGEPVIRQKGRFTITEYEL
jgi:hypothetical protein|tara:strand:- start:269 stop:523 length:255 start_codon:yes stop_codon:yes gene_type:complete